MTWFKNLKIATKVTVAFACILVMMIFMAVIALVQVARVNALGVEMATNYMPSILVVGNLKADLNGLRRQELNHVLAVDPAHMRAYEGHMQEFEQSLRKHQAEYEPLCTLDTEKKAFAEFKDRFAEYLQMHEQVLRLSQAGKKDEARIFVQDTMLKPFDAALGALVHIGEVNHQAGLDASHAGDATYQAAREWVLGIGLFALVVGGLLAFKAGMEMNQAVRSIGSNAETLATASEELSAVSQQMSANAQQTTSQAQNVSAAADQVSRNVQTVATSTEQMGASIREIAKNAMEAAQVANEAVQIAQRTNSTVAKLGDSSMEIDQVNKVVTAIAQQTNLLALNATIEAARAGEAGKGFAVVANEVKELAKETAKATEDIGRKIETIQEDTQTAVTAIGDIAEIINRINDISNTIASAVEEQSLTTNEISRNVMEVAKGGGDIATNIAGVAEAAQSTSTGTEQTQTSAADLAKMASDLQLVVGKFI